MPLAQLVAESPYVRVARRERPAHRLVCLPAAGGGASAYRHFADALPEHVEVISIQLPGREDRIREQPFTRMEPLIGALSRVMRRYLDLPMTFFGHSSGCLLAFELARALTNAGSCPVPLRLILSGFPAAHLPPDFFDAPNRTDDELIARVAKFNGIPVEVAANPQLRELIIPAVRGDLAWGAAYKHRAGPPLPWPINVFGGESDEVASPEQLAAWQIHTSGEFSLRLFPGGHFFMQSQADSVHSAIAELLS